MARAAGDTGSYIFRLYNQSNGRYEKDYEIHFESVTTVIKQTLGAPALIRWAHNVTVDMVAGLTEVIKDWDLDAVQGQDGSGATLADLYSDADILKELLTSNRLTPDDIKEDGGEAGRENHEYLELLGNIALELDEDAALARATADLESPNGWKRAIASWWVQREGGPLASEAFLYSLRHGFAGTLDLVWSCTGTCGIIDLKCRKEGRTAQEGDHVQTGAYQIAWEEMGRRPVDWRSVLIAREDGTWDEYPSYNDPADFLHLLAVNRSMKDAARKEKLARLAKKKEVKDARVL